MSSRPPSPLKPTNWWALPRPSGRPAGVCCRSCPTSPMSTRSSRPSVAWPKRRGGRCRSRSSRPGATAGVESSISSRPRTPPVWR